MGVRYAANTNEEMQKLLRSYRDNMRVEIEPGIAATASTVADLHLAERLGLKHPRRS
jgi:hypothetical protein